MSKAVKEAARRPLKLAALKVEVSISGALVTFRSQQTEALPAVIKAVTKVSMVFSSRRTAVSQAISAEKGRAYLTLSCSEARLLRRTGNRTARPGSRTPSSSPT